MFRADVDAVFASYLIRFRLDLSRVDPRFVWYCMRTPRWWDFINSSKTGSAQAGANAKVLGRFQLSLPPLREQQAIACILGTLDDKIELNRRRNRTLEAMARAIFQSWFVDFDPVHENARRANKPTRADDASRRVRSDPHPRTGVRGSSDGVESYRLSPEIAALFPDRFEDSPLGSIPAGWRVRTLPEVAEINYGKNLPASKLIRKGIPVYGAAGVIGYHTEESFQRPVVLVTCRGSNSGTVHETYGPAFITNNSFSIVPRTDWFSRHYLKYWLRSVDILARVTGSAQPQLTITNIQSLEVIEPMQEILQAFHAIIDPLWERGNANNKESRTLAALRDALLPKLICGELRVPDAERIVGRAV